MIYVEGIPLNKAEEPFKKYYQEVTQRLRQISQSSGRSEEDFAVVFKVRPKDVTQLKTKDGRRVNTTGDYCVSFHQVVHDKKLNKSIDWVYSEIPLPERDGRADVTKAPYGRWMFSQDRLTEIIKDIDLAFFLYHVDPHFGEAKDNRIYQLVDARGADEKQVESQLPEINFKYALYGEGSPLKKEETLVTVARAWGVEEAETKPVPSLQVALERAVKAGELEKQKGNKFSRGIAEFLQDVHLGERTRVLSLIQMAIDKKIVRAVSDNKQAGVFWLDEFGALAEKIINLTPRNQRYWKDLFAEHLIGNPNVLQTLRADVGVIDKTDKDTGEVLKDFDAQDFFDRFYEEDMKGVTREVAQSVGISPFGKKKGQLRQELLEYFEKEKGFVYKEKEQA
jgi:hypothetical protein